MVYSCLAIILTLFLTFDQVPPTGGGTITDLLFGTGTKSNKGLFDAWNANEEEGSNLNDGEKKIRFVVWDRKKESWVKLKQKSTSARTLLQPNVTLNVLIHGYSKERNVPFPELIARQRISNIAIAYGNAKTESNIVLVNWTSLATEPDYKYPQVVENVPLVGETVGEFILKLYKWKILTSLDNVHLTGYNVGAHVAGVAGKMIQKDEKYGGKVGRITGLDPAGVGFDDDTGQKSLNKLNSLGKYDAEFVDIIHCNLGVSRTYQDAKWKGRYGSAVQAGHVDFYPNGGTEQLGCNRVNDIIEKDCHTRSCPSYFARSIEGTKYLACGCQTFDDFEEGNCDCSLADGGVLMGEPCSKEAKGRYYLKIGKEGRNQDRRRKYSQRKVTRKPDWASLVKRRERNSDEKNSEERSAYSDGEKIYILSEGSESDEEEEDQRDNERKRAERDEERKNEDARPQKGRRRTQEVKNMYGRGLEDKTADDNADVESKSGGKGQGDMVMEDKIHNERKVNKKMYDSKKVEEGRVTDDKNFIEDRMMQEEKKGDEKNIQEKKSYERNGQEKKIQDNKVQDKIFHQKQVQQRKVVQKKSHHKKSEVRKIERKGGGGGWDKIKTSSKSSKKYEDDDDD